MPAATPEVEDVEEAPRWPMSWLRPKGNLSKAELGVLLTAGAVPLAIVLIRTLSLPDVLGSSFSGTWLASLGGTLDRALSLHSIPSNDRSSVLYMLFLPMSALIIATARLTFGIRVIGFRAILISVGFQASGIVPSLILIAVVVTIIVGVRPTLRRIRLPGTARLSVIMTIGVIVLVLALLVAPWTRSEMLWRLAFFPVIVLGLLSESIAKTLDENSGLVALWRAGMTIGIAMVIAVISQIPLLREVVLNFPELVVSELIMIILVSEYLDLRLFQDWDASLSGVVIPRLFADKGALRIAIVRNRRRAGTIGRLGVQVKGGYSRAAVRRIAKALRERGHMVERFEGDTTLFTNLGEFMPPHPRTTEPGGIVLDLTSGIQGVAASGHVASMLEMAGVAYAGSTPLGHALASDHVLRSQALAAVGIKTPSFRVVTRVGEGIEGLAYPVAVKSRSAAGHSLVVARDREALDSATRKVLRRQGPEAVVEQYIVGREIEVPLIGNDLIERLPLVEVMPDSEGRECPAKLDPVLEREIREMARDAYRAVGGRDSARVRIRLSRSGTPYLIAVDSLAGLEEGGPFEVAAAVARSSFPEVVERIVGVARERYRSVSDAQALSVVKGGVDQATDRGRASVVGS